MPGGAAQGLDVDRNAELGDRSGYAKPVRTHVGRVGLHRLYTEARRWDRESTCAKRIDDAAVVIEREHAKRELGVPDRNRAGVPDLHRGFMQQQRVVDRSRCAPPDRPNRQRQVGTLCKEPALEVSSIADADPQK